jgi:heme o synthase
MKLLAFISPSVVRASWRTRLNDIAILTKAGLTSLSVATAVVGTILADHGRHFNWVAFHVVVGTYLIGSGAAAMNQFVERRRDALMLRTAGRPLPTGRLSGVCAAVAGAISACTGTAYLAVAANPLAAALGVATFTIYVALYTPLKTRTHFATLVGAIPGALPPLIGWAAIRGTVTIEAYAFFVVMFLWQIPHFLSLGWVYREEYRNGGYSLLPVIDRHGFATGRLSLMYSICLAPACVLLATLNRLDGVWMLPLLPTVAWYVAKAWKFQRVRDVRSARALFLASIIFMPVFLLATALGAVFGAN